MVNLRRITNGRAFIPQVDGLRFIAILSVVLLHLRASLTHNAAIRNHIDPLTAYAAHRGVELFFVISAFILALPFCRAFRRDEKPSLKGYYLRRLTRLEPPYFFSLVVYTLAAVVTKTATFSDLEPHFVASVFYSDYLIFQRSNPINFVIWSLAIEVQFYLIVPAIVQIFRLRADVRRPLMIAAIFLFSMLSVGIQASFWKGTIVYYLPFFLCGFLICDIYLESPSWLGKPHPGWDLSSLVIWPLLWLLGPLFEFLAIPGILILLFVGAFKGPLTSKLLSLRWVTNIGGMCYTIYLFHIVILSAITRVTKPLHFGSNFAAYYCLQAALVLPVIFGGCFVIFVCLERPCMDRNWPRSLVASILKRRKLLPESLRPG
jgi:peptidoglycan/LPS O-acetylase OafA/YrhL